jgi:hypothetical protein
VFDIGVCNFWRFLKLICSILALSETDDVIILLISHLLEKNPISVLLQRPRYLGRNKSKLPN